MLFWVQTCQNTTLIEITCRGSAVAAAAVRSKVVMMLF